MSQINELVSINRVEILQSAHHVLTACSKTRTTKLVLGYITIRTLGELVTLRDVHHPRCLSFGRSFRSPTQLELRTIHGSF